MCIAAVVPAGLKITEDQLTSCRNRNPDGAGMAYVKDGKVHIKKGLFKIEDIVSTYNMLADSYGKDNPMLVHFRIATQGVVGEKNCHPFPIKGGAVIHNGILWNVGGRTALKSDTAELFAALHNVFNKNDVEKAKAQIEIALGYSNKIAALYDDGSTVVLNESSWTKSDSGVLFSNNCYLPPRDRYMRH